jgi:hypothetical protein
MLISHAPMLCGSRPAAAAQTATWRHSDRRRLPAVAGRRVDVGDGVNPLLIVEEQAVKPRRHGRVVVRGADELRVVSVH